MPFCSESRYIFIVHIDSAAWNPHQHLDYECIFIRFFFSEVLEKRPLTVLKVLYNRRLFNTTSRCVYCMCFYLFSTISNYNRIFHSVYRLIFISILEKKCTKEKILSTSTSFLWFLHQTGNQITSLSSTVRHYTLLAFWLLLHGCVCARVCVNLWKLYYANCYLNFFSRENYLNKWEYFFIFLQKMSVFLLFLISYTELVAFHFKNPKMQVFYIHVFRRCWGLTQSNIRAKLTVQSS